jgi:molybdopterin/thiamine biosynthesis adenylyltransferase
MSKRTESKKIRPSYNEKISWLDHKKLRSAKVLVVGVGALGNEVLKNLAFSGVRNISIVDEDKVEISNLSKCILFRVPSSEFRVRDSGLREYKVDVVKRSLKELVPEIKIDKHIKNIEDMPEDFIPDFDVVLGCVDNIEARLHINAQCYHYQVTYIDGGLDEFTGKVHVVLPPDTACIQCRMNGSHWKELRKRYSCTGVKQTVYRRPIQTEITTASVIGGMQVREALKLICGEKEEMIKNYIYYDGYKNRIEELELGIDPGCLMHCKR